MFTTFIVQPIFNILTLIYALIPGHNFGIAIILFTILTRFALYPMLKKQLKHTKAMREMQPELKKIKEKTKGNRQQESVMTMELYKEREIKPLSFIGLMILQIVLFFALFSGLNRVVNNPQEIYDFSYPVIQNLDFMQELNNDISKFDNTLFGTVDLSRAAIGSEQGFYFPAFLLVLGSALIQFVQIKQTMPSQKNGRKLREILADANSGKQSDSTEINAAMGRNMSYFLPAIIFVVTIGFPAALSLYWFVGGLVAYLQQRYLLTQDEYAMKEIAEAEVISKKPLKKKSAAQEKPAKKTPSTTATTTKSGVVVTTYKESDLKKEKTANKEKPTAAKKKPGKKGKKRKR